MVTIDFDIFKTTLEHEEDHSKFQISLFEDHLSNGYSLIHLYVSFVSSWWHLDVNLNDQFDLHNHYEFYKV